MSLGQRARRSWLFNAVLCSTALLVVAAIAGYAGTSKSLISPYKSAMSLMKRSAASGERSKSSIGSSARNAQRGASSAKSGSAAYGAKSSKAKFLGNGWTDNDVNPTYNHNPPYDPSLLNQDDIHPSWYEDGERYVWSSTAAVPAADPAVKTPLYQKILPAPVDATTTTPTTTSSLSKGGSKPLQTTPDQTTLASIPEYSVFLNNLNPNFPSGVTIGSLTTTSTSTTSASQTAPSIVQLTRRTGNQIYPSLNPTAFQENLTKDYPFLLYVTSPEAAGATTSTDASGNTTTTPPTAPSPLPWSLEMLNVTQMTWDDPTTEAPRLKIITPACANVEHPSWAPDGRYFVFSCQDAASGNWTLYYGSMTNNTIASGWTEDDATSEGDAQPIISVFPVSGTASGSLYDSSMPDAVDPVWSPDGNYIAFTRGTVVLNGAPEKASKIPASKWNQTAVPPATNPLRAYLTYSNTHIWICPVRGYNAVVSSDSGASSAPGGSLTLGSPKEITNFSVLKSGTATPVSSKEFQPAWTPGMGLGFVTNRDDTNGDRIPDAVGKSYSVYTVFNGTDAEGAGAAILYSNNGNVVTNYSGGRNVARKDTFSVPAPEGYNEYYPSFNPQTPAPVEFSLDLIYQIDLDTDQANGGTPTPPLDANYPLNDIWETSTTADSDEVFLLQGLPSVTPRLSPPGTTVKIKAEVTPKGAYQSVLKVAKVYAIIRDPDQKIFGGMPAPTKTGNEYDFSSTQKPGAVMYDQVDSGITVPISMETGSTPLDVVSLYDDGPSGGHGDAVAGDGIYTNTWVTPTSSHDYYLDIAVSGDRALTTSTGTSLAFDYFDNVWGFSTRRFTRTANLLLVSDHTSGQTFLTSATNRNPETRGYTLFPVESYYTTRPAPTATIEDEPKQVYTWSLFDASPKFGYGWSVLGPNSPFSDEFDIWRTQCRDSYPSATDLGGDATFNANQTLQDAISAYLPHDETSYTSGGSKKTIKYADRAIVWASPYAGDITMGDDDSIMNPSIQQMLITYLNKGGRLMLTGQDNAWALTYDGTKTNKLLNDYFHVLYLDDGDNDVVLNMLNYVGNRHVLNSGGGTGTTTSTSTTTSTTTTTTTSSVVGKNNTPISTEALSPEWLWITGEFQPTTLELTGFFGITDPPFSDTDTKHDGCWNQTLIDGITGNVSLSPTAQTDGALATTTSTTSTTATTTTVPGATPDTPLAQYTFGASAAFDSHLSMTAQRDAAYIYQDSVKNSRTVFLSFGLEGINRHYERVSVGNTEYVFCSNRPAQVMHNSVCWLRQGGFKGRVTDINLGRPLSGAVVIAYTPTTVGDVVTSTFASAGVTDDDGYYTIIGLDAGVYQLMVYKPGYVFEHAQNMGVEGGHIIDNDISTYLAMTRLPPGNITGTVTDSSGKAVPGIEVEARMVQDMFNASLTITNGPVYTTKTDSSGKYTITGAQVGVYEVTAKVDGVVQAITNNIRVNSNSTATANLTITGSVSKTTVSGTLSNADSTPATNITVTATDSTGAATTATTDTSGSFTLKLTPGDYTLSATDASGNVLTSAITVGATAMTVTLQFSSAPGTAITLPSGLNLVSLPSEFGGQDFLSLLQSQKVATWDGTQYQTYPNSPAKTVAGGRGYFINLASPVTLTVPSGDTSTVRQITLQSGWNLIGDPFAVSVPSSSIRVSYNGSSLSLAEAAGQNLLISTLWSLSGSDYIKSTTLDPGKGYWIYSKTSLTLSVTTSASSSSLSLAMNPASDWFNRARSLDAWMEILNRKTRNSR